MHPKEIHLCVAIVRYRTKLRIPRKGVGTTFLAALRSGTEEHYLLDLTIFNLFNIGDSLRIGIQKSLFNFPKSKTTPLICVGPGTGIAPVRAMIEDRIHQGIHGK
jgi:sulfite reductase alpha subunit-like flavoprotein